MLATAETVMKHIVSHVMVLADGIALAFAGGATAFAVASVLAIGPSVRPMPLPACAGPHILFRSQDAFPFACGGR